MPYAPSARNLLSTCLLSLALATGIRAAEPVATETFRADTRGFGQVEVTLAAQGPEGERRSRTSFRAEDAAHARLCASKRLADLTGFGDLAVVPDAGLPGTVVAADEVGAWLLGVRGVVFEELHAPDLAALKSYAAAAKLTGLAPVAERAYPRFLDCFDNAGPGIWVGGGGDNYEVERDFAWLKERRLAMCTMVANESRLVAPGLIDNSINEWNAAMAAKHDIPYRSLLFPGRPAWAWNRTPLPYVIAAPGSLSYPYPDAQADAIHTSYEPNAATDRYIHDMRRRLAEFFKADPNSLGAHGSTEVPDAGILELATVAGMPEIAALWHSYLVGLGYDLPSVSRLHTGDPARYHSWAEVRVPLPEDFVGWDPATCVDLRGTWDVRADSGNQGRDGRWFADTASEGWTKAAHNDVLIQMHRERYNFGNTVRNPFWMRRTVDVPAARSKDAKYLHIARIAYHGNFSPAFDVWLNGTPLKLLTSDVRGDWDQCYDLGDALRAGGNTIAMDTHGSPVPGYIFLSGRPHRTYPHMDQATNRRWYDAVGFSAWLRMRTLEDNLRAQRAGDPDRPLKLMALINLLDLATPLAKRYGAYFHDTGGAAAFWAPMTGARLSSTHGLPWSCEQGSPPNNVADMQKAVTMYVMLGNDAMDLVFGVGHYSKKPEVSAWIDRNLELVHCIGKMRMPTPKVAILRSTRSTRMGFGEPWNWDIGRGELQAVGRNFTYLETGDLCTETAAQHPVIFDDGTILMTDEDIAGLESYVRQGGVFIAQHVTGRHAPDRADAWPIARLTGVTATNQGKDVGGPLRFSQTQSLWPQLRGRELDGRGIALDWQGQDISGTPVALLADAADVEVIAEWTKPAAGQGTAAVTARRIGKGTIITLGSTFWRDARDAGGAYRSGDGAQEVLDELLTTLGVPRDSWTGTRDVWAELWRSKNGVYDLYPVAQMNESAGEVEATVSLRRERRVPHLVEVSALGHPKVAVTWADGRITLPETAYGKMQSRVYLAPRADRERAGLDWFRAQAAHWRALPPVPTTARAEVIATPEDIRPLVEGWKLASATTADDAAIPAWVAAEQDDPTWKVVRLGAFGTLGLPENAIGRFRQTVALPKGWQGRRVDLVFDAPYWF
nr:hypothetical protein [Planctomycetota bacterium]